MNSPLVAVEHVAVLRGSELIEVPVRLLVERELEAGIEQHRSFAAVAAAQQQIPGQGVA